MMRIRLAAALAVGLLLAAPRADAQVRITGGISGTVTDPSDAVIPGATVQLTDEATGITRDSVTNSAGAFQYPDLNSGRYTVKVSLQGFQSALYSKVVVEAGRTTDLHVKLTVGNTTEAITVSGAAPVLETTQNTVSSTIDRKQVVELPLASRDAFALARHVPGAVAPAGTGSTHYNGMPGGTINPTIDGVNNSSNGFKSGGTSFFGTVPARVDAIEAVTVESAGLGGDAGIEGGVNLKFETRRGTSKYHGGAFDEAQSDQLNANSYFNTSRGLPEGKLRRHDFGFNFGGPLVPSGKWRDKLFIFVNLEEQYNPLTQARTNLILTQEAEQGIFRYQTAAGEQRTVNVLDIAAANGFPSAKDPLIAAILAKETTARSLGTTAPNNLRADNLSWVQPQTNVNYYPTARMDYQINPKLSWMGSWSLYRQDARGRPQWPFEGQPIQLDTFHSSWWITSTGLNWQPKNSLFNEFRYGVQHSGDDTPGREFEDYKLNGIANTGLPLRVQFPGALGNVNNVGLIPISADNAPITGRHYITTIYDTATWLKGGHTLKFGGNYRNTQWHDTSFSGAGSGGFLGLPRYTIGSPAGDPAAGIFNATTIPGLVAADQATAVALYALLTGRVSQVQTGKVVDISTRSYSDQVAGENWTSAWFNGLFASDSWRVKPNFTLNYGMRWEFAQAPYNHLGIAVFPDFANLFGPSSGLFQPGVLNGEANPVMRSGKVAAKADWVNPAPRVGFAWTPDFEDGSLAGRILGHGAQTVIRGSYDITYYDEGTNMFSGTAGNNPGQSQGLLLAPGNGFVPGQLTLQSPLPGFVAFPLQYQDVWPQSDFTFGTTGFSTMKDTLKLPSVQSFNIGVQREIMKNTVLEVRYLQNRGDNVWHTYNINEVNTIENGFAAEFKNAQRNLAINQAAGVQSFANAGRPGQVPLPIFDAMFGARGSQPALPAAQGYTNGTFINNLTLGEAGRMAQSLASNVNFACRLYGNNFGPCATRGFNAPGAQPINFWYANPFGTGGNVNLVDDNSFTRYKALQLQLRRRYAQGVTATVNYTLGKNTSDLWADNATQTFNYTTLRDKGHNIGPSPFDVRHVLQAYGTYDLPFGKDRRFNVNNAVLNAIVGDWVVGGIVTAQSGSPFRLSSGRQTLNQEDAGVVLAPGVSVKDLQNMVGNFPGPGVNRTFFDPKLIGPDGRANPQFLLPPTTPGELGNLVYLRTPATWTFDASLNKSIPLTPGGATLNFHVTALNVLNHPVWSTGNNAGGVGLNFLNDSNITSTTFGQVGQPLSTARRILIRTEVRF